MHKIITTTLTAGLTLAVLAGGAFAATESNGGGRGLGAQSSGMGRGMGMGANGGSIGMDRANQRSYAERAARGSDYCGTVQRELNGKCVDKR